MKILHCLRKIRLSEVVLMSGFVLISLPYLNKSYSEFEFYKLTLLFFGSVLLFLSIYALNSYFGFLSDQDNPRFKGGLFQGSQSYFLLSVFGSLGSLLCFSILGHSLVILASIIFFLWALYSWPGGAKGKPIFGTGIHLVGQVAQFHLGVCVFSAPSMRTLAISVFFALLFSSGHILHELRDYSSDKSAEILTNAVFFGVRRMLLAYDLCVALLFLYWISLYWLRLISFQQFFPFLMATGIQLGMIAFRAPSDPINSLWYQSFYRSIYLVGGLMTFWLART